MTLAPGSAPEPDIVVTAPRADDYITGHPTPAEILVLIEISDTTRDRDERAKLPLYARHRIPECWLVDVNARVIHVHTRPEGEAYAGHVEVAFADGRVASPALGRAFDFELPTGD